MGQSAARHVAQAPKTAGAAAAKSAATNWGEERRAWGWARHRRCFSNWLWRRDDVRSAGFWQLEHAAFTKLEFIFVLLLFSEWAKAQRPEQHPYLLCVCILAAG